MHSNKQHSPLSCLKVSRGFSLGNSRARNLCLNTAGWWEVRKLPQKRKQRSSKESFSDAALLFESHKESKSCQTAQTSYFWLVVSPFKTLILHWEDGNDPQFKGIWRQSISAQMGLARVPNILSNEEINTILMIFLECTEFIRWNCQHPLEQTFWLSSFPFVLLNVALHVWEFILTLTSNYNSFKFWELIAFSGWLIAADFTGFNQICWHWVPLETGSLVSVSWHS